MSKVDVFTEIVINRPIDEVAEYVANPDNAPEWYVNIKSIRWETEPPITIGSRMAFVAQFMGRELAYTYEIRELEPGQRLMMSTAEGPFPMETSYQWEAIDDTTTRMSLRNRGNPSGFSGLMAPLTAKMMRGANEKDLVMLKGILEARAGG
jgi:uncharacterized membrane protein